MKSEPEFFVVMTAQREADGRLLSGDDTGGGVGVPRADQFPACWSSNCSWTPFTEHTRVGTLIVATVYLQLIQNRYMFRSFTVLQCSRQHCVQPVASDVEVVGYL